MDPRVTEFHCIMPMANVPSVLAHGILSYERATRLAHHSVAMQPVQDRRDQKQVPGGLKLHQYAHLYFHARNPMMFVRKEEASQLCVLRVSAAVLDLPGVVLADRNASSGWVRFLAPSQWAVLDFDAIYARDWRHPNQFEFFARKSKKCAEVLVPGAVEPHLLTGAHAVDQGAAERLAGLGFRLPVKVDPDLFFH
jgi:hypothetical protein